MNKVILDGRFAADPELKATKAGKSVVSFTLATNNYSGGESSKTDWIDCVAWGSTAEWICRYFTKGSPIQVEGHLETNFWEDKSGNKRKDTELVIDKAEFCLRPKNEQ